MDGHGKIDVLIARRKVDTSGAIQLELRRSDSGALPCFEAGAHVDLFLANGLIRSYSLMNTPGETDRFVVGVGLDRNSRGGSIFIHEQLREGDRLAITAPKNLFTLNEAADHSMLFAGGIGVTPLIAMTRRLNVLGRRWTFHYCARSRALGPFFAEAQALGSNVLPHFDDEAGGALLDFRAAIADAPHGTHFYCCGPSAMIGAFELAALSLAVPPEQVHVERFSADEAPATDGGFTVELAKSGVTVRVDAGQTILEAIEAVGIDVPFSCLAGICGSCVTPVLEGLPDHRDMVLTDRERRRNDRMMICCSGSLSDRLILDR